MLALWTLVSALFEAMRPKQWTKNGLLFAALIFSRHALELPSFLRATAATAIFCVLSSCGYIFNDYLDREADRRHPRKCKRPIASGRLPATVALVYMVIITLGGIASGFMLEPAFGWTSVAYILLTVSYTLVLKHIVILDVMALSAGFIIRAVAGAMAIPVLISPWFLICTAFGSLFLALNKRLSELLLLEHGAAKHRKILEEYTPELLDRMINAVTAGTIMSYALYTFDASAHPDQPQRLMLTIPFVVYGFFRYLYLVARQGEGGAPELTLLSDRPLQITVLLYTLTVLIILYFD